MGSVSTDEERDVAPAAEIPIHRRLLPVLLPLLVNYPFTIYGDQIYDMVDAIRPFDQYTYRPYVVAVTLIGSMLLPAISMDGYGRWVIGERRRIDRWSAWRLGALVLAAAAVVVQCKLAYDLTFHGFSGWWSLTRWFGQAVGPAVGLLVPIVTLVIAVRWAIVRGRDVFELRRRGTQP